MKKLVFATLLLGGLSQATGCIFVSDGDDDVVDSSTFLVSWDLETGLTDPPSAISCADAGAATIRTISEPTGGAQIVDLFDCTDGFHETAPLPLSDYLVWTEALDSGDFLLAQSFAQEQTLFDGNPVAADFVFPVDAGYLALTWTLTDLDTSPPSALTCADVGGDGVSVLATQVGGASTGYDEIFNCADGSSGQISFDQRTLLPIDDYTVVVALIDANDQTLSDSSQPRSVSIDYGNELEDLGNFEFTFTDQSQ